MDESMNNQWFHFYVEKFEKPSATLLIDFMDEDEYLSFRRIVQDRIKVEDLHPDYTILVITDFSSNNVHEGGMLIVCRNIIEEWCKRVDKYNIENKQEEQTENLSNSSISNNYLMFINNNNNIELEFQNGNIISKKYPYKRFLDNSLSLNKYELDPLFIVQFAADFDTDPQKLIVWNVGQGNANEIVLNDGSLMFDCGCDWHYSFNQIEDIISKRNIEKVVLIISHWDLDHYKLLDTPNETLMRKVELAIFPTIMYSLTSKRIASYLISRLKKRCYTISPENCIDTHRLKLKEQLCPFCEGMCIDLFVGNYVKSTNVSGLSLTVETKSQVLLLTGDHDSSQVWDDQLNYVKPDTIPRYLNIVVPHHGGGKSPKTIPILSSFVCNKAIISVGYDNLYGHPYKTVIDFYKKHFKCVCMTSLSYSDIELPLT